MHLVGFIMRIYDGAARSHECQNQNPSREESKSRLNSEDACCHLCFCPLCLRPPSLREWHYFRDIYRPKKCTNCHFLER